MPQDEISDGVTLRDILARLWRDRGLVIAFPVLGAILGLAIMADSTFRTRHPVVYYITLNNITDPDKAEGAKKPPLARNVIEFSSSNSKYPNGTAFQPSDLVSPPVLSRLKDVLKLGDNVDLGGNIQVDLDSPLAESITRIYRDRLQARNLTQVDIESLNQAYSKQLDAAIANGLRIEVNYAGMGVDEAQGIAIARELPKAWTEVYTRQFRTLVAPELSASIPPATIADFKAPTGVLSLDARLTEIKRGLKIISDDNRLGAVQDSQGSTAADLAERANLYADVYFAPIFASSASDDTLVSTVFLRDQTLRVEQYKRQVASIDEAITRLQAYSSGGTVSPPSTPSGTSGQPMFQLDSGAFSQIVGLTERASSVEYLKTLLDARQEATDELAAIQRKVDLARMPEAFAGSAVDPALQQQANDGFNALAGRYNELLAAARQLAEDRSGTLYAAKVPPVVQGGLVDYTYRALVAALALAGLFVAAAYAIFRGPVSRAKRQRA